MSLARMVVAATLVTASALTVPTAGTASASAVPAAATTPADDCRTAPPLPYKLHAKSARIRAKASKTSAVVGMLYTGQKFTVHKHRGGRVNLTNKAIGVRNWVHNSLVYRDVRICLP